MKVRTVAAILVWVAAVSLLLNAYFRSDWILLLAVITAVIAVLLYFSSNLRNRNKSAK